MSYEADGENAVADGQLRCAGCGRYTKATPEQLEQASVADAEFAVEQEVAEAEGRDFVSLGGWRRC